MAQASSSKPLRIYDGRPDADALAARMRRDRVRGDARPIVRPGEGITTGSQFEVITTGVFDQNGKMVAHYRTRRDRRIAGTVAGSHSFGWMAPREGEYRFATDDDLARVRPAATSSDPSN